MSLAKPTEVKDVSDVELPCFSSATCYVHARIPPCDTLGHKADCWNVSKPDFVCALQALTRGDLFIVRLLTEDQQIFAESFWKPDKPMSSLDWTSEISNSRCQNDVEAKTLKNICEYSCPMDNSMCVWIIDAAMDSSRYFALRVENPETGSHVFIGVGFADRETSGQFKLTLAEHGRYLQRMQKAERDHLASPGTGPNPLGDASGSLLHTGTDSPLSSRLSTDSGRSGSPTAMRDLALHGTVRVDLPNMGEKRGLMAKGRPAGGSALPLLLRGSSGRGLLPPPPGRVLCRDVSGGHRSDDDDVLGRGFSAPGSARSGSSVDMDSTPTATSRQVVPARSTLASPQIAPGSTGGTATSSGLMETNTSMGASVVASAAETSAADEEFGEFCEAQG